MADITKITSGTLIAAEKVEGTDIYDLQGEKLGTVDDIMIDKVSGKAIYALMSFVGPRGTVIVPAGFLLEIVVIQPPPVQRWKSRSIDEVVRHGGGRRPVVGCRFSPRPDRHPTRPVGGLRQDDDGGRAADAVDVPPGLRQGRRSDPRAPDLSDPRRLR